MSSWGSAAVAAQVTDTRNSNISETASTFPEPLSNWVRNGHQVGKCVSSQKKKQMHHESFPRILRNGYQLHSSALRLFSSVKSLENSKHPKLTMASFKTMTDSHKLYMWNQEEHFLKSVIKFSITVKEKCENSVSREYSNHCKCQGRWQREPMEMNCLIISSFLILSKVNPGNLSSGHHQLINSNHVQNTVTYVKFVISGKTGLNLNWR